MQIQTHPLLSPAPGTQRELVSLHYGQVGGQKAYIQASLHADELPGMLVAYHLRLKLDALQATGQVLGEIILVPMANPIGLSQFQFYMHQGRFETTTGENFNRHYPDQSAAAASAAEAELTQDSAHNTRVLRRELKKAVSVTQADTELKSLRRTLMSLSCDADIVLDLHCDGQAVMHLYTETPCWPECEVLARFIGARVTLLAQESGDHPFDEACSQGWWHWAQQFEGRFPIAQACMSVTVELRGAADVEHSLAARDAQNILDFLTFRGLIAGPTPALPNAVGDARPLAGCMPIKAETAGVLTFLRQPGDSVLAGDVLAHVIDPISAVVSELKSPVDGLFFARDFVRFATAGMKVGKVAGLEPLRTGKLLGA